MTSRRFSRVTPDHDVSAGRVRRNDEEHGLERDPTPPWPRERPRGSEVGEARTFFDELGAILADAPPMRGEEAQYAQLSAVLTAAKKDPRLKAAMVKAAVDADATIVDPLLQFRNYGQPLPHNWSTISNEAAFGTDYFTRTAAARSNIFVNSPNETTYYYQDLDERGERLNGARRYTVTFARGETPPVNGFWSLTLYDEQHFFVPNPIKRYSVGTKNKSLKLARTAR